MTMPTKTHTVAAHPGAGHHFRVSWRAVAAGAVIIGAVVALFAFTELEWRDVPALLQRVSRPWALAIMATAPLLGFPISAVYLAAGALFGPWLGLAVVAGATAVHLGVTQLLATTLLRDPIERWRKKWSRQIPELPHKEDAALVAMVVLVPGLPYFARNCLLALSKASWRVVVAVGLPLYVVRSATTIFLGDLGNDPSWQALSLLGAIYLVKLAISVMLFQHLRHTVRRPKSATR